MAVYQISRIQIRRGQANSGTGLPQLASGEMAWAIDTQQLYIGSGAVSEGAPAVSNIRIVTEQDLGLQGSLLGLVQYVYGSSNASITTGPNANSPVGRSINLRLDDQITTADFGTAGDGQTDDTAALQRAIDQLFLNPSQTSNQFSTQYPLGTSGAVKTRVTLSVPPGVYNTTSTIYIPSYTTLIGAGIDKTFINYKPTQVTITGSINLNSAILTTLSAASTYNGWTITCPTYPNLFNASAKTTAKVTTVNSGVSFTLSNTSLYNLANVTFVLTNPAPAIQFVNDSSTPGNPDVSAVSSTNQARKIQISNLTVKTDTGLNTLMQMNSVRDSRFENISLIGYAPTTTSFSGIINSNSIGIALNSPVSAQIQDNVFKNIRATNFNYCVYSYQDTTHKAELLNNLFEDCYFANSLMGVYLGAGYVYNSSSAPNGPLQNEIVNAKFYYVAQEAIYIAAGTNNIVRDCKYVGVGNNLNSNIFSQYPQVYFATYGNASIGDISDRNTDLANPNTSTNASFALVPYVPVVSGHGTYSLTGTNTITLSNPSAYTQIFKLSATWLSSQTTPAATYLGAYGPTGQVTYIVNYVYSSSLNFTRQGQLIITADVAHSQIQLSDEYNYAGSDDSNDSYSVYLDFQAQFLDKNGVLTSISGLAPWTIVVSYINTLPSDGGALSYTYSAVF